MRQRRWSTAVEGARDVAEWASYSTSFLLTGERACLGGWGPVGSEHVGRRGCSCGGTAGVAVQPRPPPRRPAPHSLTPRPLPWDPRPRAGNLLAPYVAAVASDLVFSGYQRLKASQVDAAQERSMRQIRELTQAARAVEAARKSSLAPPSTPADGQQEAGSGSGGGDVSGEAEGDSSAVNGSAAAESKSGKADEPVASSGKSDAE